MKSFSLSPIAKAIAAVFWLWRHDPQSHHLVENQPKPDSPAARSMDESVAEMSAALRSSKIVPATFSESAMQFVPVKPKRVRIRSPKLYACDIEVGAAYVPKRGNDKTPNIIVSAVTLDDDDMVTGVWWHRANESAVDTTFAQVDDFLSIVARRVD